MNSKRSTEIVAVPRSKPLRSSSCKYLRRALPKHAGWEAAKGTHLRNIYIYIIYPTSKCPKIFKLNKSCIESTSHCCCYFCWCCHCFTYHRIVVAADCCCSKQPCPYVDQSILPINMQVLWSNEIIHHLRKAWSMDKSLLDLPFEGMSLKEIQRTSAWCNNYSHILRDGFRRNTWQMMMVFVQCQNQKKRRFKAERQLKKHV